jgi:hypothetical protein
MSYRAWATIVWSTVFAVIFISVFWTWTIVNRHHRMEDQFAEKYWVSSVRLGWGSEGVEWTNTEKTHRCEGYYIDGNLMVRFCRPIIPPAPEPQR